MSTIHREDFVCVRFSSLLQRAPLTVREGAALLHSGVYRSKAPRAQEKLFADFLRARRILVDLVR